MKSKIVEIYTDGSCDNYITKAGSWAYIVVLDNKIIAERKESESNTTSNRMEYKAFIASVLEHVNDYDELHIFSDSQLLVNTFNSWMHKWSLAKRAKRANLDLVEMLEIIYEQFGHKIKLQWVRGHSGNVWNEYVDNLANGGVPNQNLIGSNASKLHKATPAFSIQGNSRQASFPIDN